MLLHFQILKVVMSNNIYKKKTVPITKCPSYIWRVKIYVSGIFSLYVINTGRRKFYAVRNDIVCNLCFIEKNLTQIIIQTRNTDVLN